jgi:stage II sporulation protein D
VLPNGKVGYVRQDLVMLSGTNKAGLQLAYVIENNVNVRPTPDTTGTPITQVSKGDPLVVVETVKETNAYSWISQLWRADALATRINQYARSSLNGPLQSLQVGERGISGRVKTVIANGSQQIDVSYPDAYRTVMGGLRSTRFDIEQTNDLTILGAGGKQVNVRNGATELYVLTGSSATSGEQLTGDYLIAVNQAGKARVGSLDAQFRFVGRGYGHGLGMSQYGAKALADIGYDYKRILQYYYKDVQVVKG